MKSIYSIQIQIQVSNGRSGISQVRSGQASQDGLRLGRLSWDHANLVDIGQVKSGPSQASRVAFGWAQVEPSLV